MSKSVNVYRIRWRFVATEHSPSIEKEDLVLSDSVAEIVKRYDNIISVDWLGPAEDLRST